MIVGVGCDVVDIRRIEKIWNRYKYVFVERYFIGEEVQRAHSMRAPSVPAFLASRFAAKEAFVKAIGSGFSNGIVPKNIEVCSHKTGEPYLRLHGAALRLLQVKNAKTYVTISHEKEYAMSFVVLDLFVEK
ncbi:MAG: holo-ACP synthase [Alphaproteobacteria bacterium]|nr:holo-ACP synthase [Alphaproteobacteria bacterium]